MFQCHALIILPSSLRGDSDIPIPTSLHRKVLLQGRKSVQGSAESVVVGNHRSTHGSDRPQVCPLRYESLPIKTDHSRLDAFLSSMRPWTKVGIATVHYFCSLYCIRWRQGYLLGSK